MMTAGTEDFRANCAPKASQSKSRRRQQGFHRPASAPRSRNQVRASSQGLRPLMAPPSIRLFVAGRREAARYWLTQTGQLAPESSTSRVGAASGDDQPFASNSADDELLTAVQHRWNGVPGVLLPGRIVPISPPRPRCPRRTRRRLP